MLVDTKSEIYPSGIEKLFFQTNYGSEIKIKKIGKRRNNRRHNFVKIKVRVKGDVLQFW
jgi:hypothetical protein